MKTSDNNITKMYDLMVTYDARCIDVIKATVAEKKVPTKVLTTTYLYIKNLTSEQVDSYKKILSACEVKSSDGTKTYKVRFSSYKCDAILPKEKKEEKNTEEHKPADPKNKQAKLDRLARKAKKKNTQKAIAAATRSCHRGGGFNTAHALKRNANKKEHKVGRNARLWYIDDESGMTRWIHKTGTLETNLEKKIRQRATKAGKYVIKQETPKPVMTATKTKKTTKPVQKKLALAA